MGKVKVLRTYRENNRTYADAVCPACKGLYRTRVDHLQSKGYKTSCKPCSSVQKGFKHGFHREKLYRVHVEMKSRCRNKNNENYKNYGGRGISVCDEWMEYTVFRKWCMDHGYRQGLTVDRIDNDKGYSPDNCRIADRFCQNQNQRVLNTRNTSGYKGVSYHKGAGKFIVEIMIKGEKHYLGLYEDARDGALAYDNFAKEHSEFTSLNGV